jgi:hypothetical protein
MMLVVNKMHRDFDAASLGERLAESYRTEVGAMIYFSDTLMRMGSSGLITLSNPQADFSHAIRALATSIQHPGVAEGVVADQPRQQGARQ